MGCDGSSSLQPVFRLVGEHRRHQLAEAAVEAARRRSSLRRRGTRRGRGNRGASAASLPLLARGRWAAGSGCRKDRAPAPASGRRPRPGQVDHLPGQVATATRLDVGGEVATSLRCWFQSSPGPWRSLASSTGRRPLERNSSARLVPMTARPRRGRALPVPSPMCPAGGPGKSAPFAIPIVAADEPPGGEPADAFHAVKIVEPPQCRGGRRGCC